MGSYFNAKLRNILLNKIIKKSRDKLKNIFKQDNSIPVKSISLIKDKTGGAVSDVVNDTTSSVKDDIASLTSKVNNILLALKNLGIVK